MSAIQMTWSRMLRLLSALRSKWPKANPYPLSLAAAQVSSLKGLLEQPEQWAAYRVVCERYAALAFEELQQADCPPARVHFLRGQIAAALYLADLPELIVTKTEEFHAYQRNAARTGRPASSDRSAFWGSDYFNADDGA